jgi:mono/diheme cytochrome c family protein
MRAGLRLAPALAGLVVAVAAGCGGTGHVEAGSASRGQELFNEQCAQCHTLAAAGAVGTIGPDLDAAFAGPRSEGFDESTMRDLVRAQIAYPVEDTVTGAPGMPANLVVGDDADAVAAYVAEVAGNPDVAPPPSAGVDEGETDPKAIYDGAGCGSCHTFADAGSNGTIGPNLDEASPSVDLAIDRVTNGQGQMPAFKDRLTEEQIRLVAEYVTGGS